MNAQIRPNRLEVSDRFPMVGFTIRTDEPRARAEVAIAVDPSLFLPEMKAKRTLATFYCSRASGPLFVPRGEAVYLLPPEALARFIGQDRLYVALAVSPERNGTTPHVAVLPTEGSPYISLKGLTGRSLKRVRVLPRNSYRNGSYGANDMAALEWAGDAAAPGTKPVTNGNGSAVQTSPSRNGNKASAPVNGSTNGHDKSAAPATPVDYDDGFGPLPEKPETTSAPAESQAYARAARSAVGSARAQTVHTPKRAALARAQEIVTPFYDPADPSTALTCQNDAFSLAREEWFSGVPNTQIFPHSAICQLHMTAPDGNSYQGTGFYIGRNRILTCAHNLHGMSSVTIIPGRNGAGSKPYGQRTVQSSSWRVAPSYSGDGDWNNDLAVIDNVPIDAPHGQWFRFLNATPSDQLPVVVCGYSAASRAVPELTQAIDGDAQHLHGGYVTEQTNLEVIEYPILTLMGASGSPVYHLSSASGQLEALICAVHVSGEPAAQGLNRGCFITPSKINWIEGRATAFSLNAQALEVPLDPGVGGMSIGVDALQAGDIIVSTARHAVSYAIRAGTFSAVSHAMLYIGDGKVIEAVGSGVREIALADAIGDAILAVAYRDSRVTTAIAQAIVEYARGRVANPYNYAGVAFTGYRILHPLPARIIDGIASRLGVEVGQAGAAYCSELVMEAFENAGIPLVASRPATSTPDDLTQLSRSVLSYVGHLRGEDVPLGIPLALSQRNGQRRLPRGLSENNGGVQEPVNETIPQEEVLMPPPPPPRARGLSAGADAAIAIGGFLLETVRDSSGDVTWELDQFANRKHPNDTPPANPAAFRDAATIKLDKWPVSGGVVDDISAWFSIDWQYNGLSLGNVRITNIGTNDAVGWALHVRAQIMDDNILYEPANCAALRIRFHYRFSRGIGSDTIAITDVHLFGDGTWESSGQWVQSTVLGLGQEQADKPTRSMDVGTVTAVIGTAISLVGGQAVTNPSWLETWHPNGVVPEGRREWQKKRIELRNVPFAMGPFDKMTAYFTIEWEYDGLSLRNIFFYPSVNTALLNDVEVAVDVIKRDARRGNVFVPNSPLVAVVELRFKYRFIHKVDDDEIAVHRAEIWGDGGSWQNPEPEWIKGGRDPYAYYLPAGQVRPGGRRSVFEQ